MQWVHICKRAAEKMAVVKQHKNKVEMRSWQFLTVGAGATTNIIQSVTLPIAIKVIKVIRGEQVQITTMNALVQDVWFRIGLIKVCYKLLIKIITISRDKYPLSTVSPRRLWLCFSCQLQQVPQPIPYIIYHISFVWHTSTERAS